MGAAKRMLKLTEAAVVAGVALRDINRAIDENILPEGFFSLSDGRSVLATGCMLIGFYVGSARLLTAEARLRVIGEAALRLKRFRGRTLASLTEEDWIVRDKFLTIDLSPFVRRTRDGLDRLAEACAMVTSDPEILGGIPVLRGTRVPVHDVAASVAAGFAMERILAAYPSLNADAIELAAIWSCAYPPRGRPRRVDEICPELVLVSERHVPHEGRNG